MTRPVHENSVDGSPSVVVQAADIHGDVTIYQLPERASAEDKYELGLRYLDGGMPAQARYYLHEAVLAGKVSSDCYFHWFLAQLSGRTLRQLPDEDFVLLRSAPQLFPAHPDDEWMTGVRLIWRLLESLEAPDTESADTEKAFAELGEFQREKIDRHLELFVKGSLQDALWTQAVRRATEQQLSGQRQDRVWRFFQPDPIPARVRWPAPVRNDFSRRVGAAAVTAGLVAALGIFAVLAVRGGGIATAPAFLLMVGGGYSCLRNGLIWRFRLTRGEVDEEERKNCQRRMTAASAEGGFTAQLDRRFKYYFAKYRPEGFPEEAWLNETAGLRASLQDELSEIYRESRVEVRRVAWLVRYLASEAKRRWQSGIPLEYQERLHTPVKVKAGTVLGGVALAAGTFFAAGDAFSAGPFSAVVLIAIAAEFGWLTVRSLSRLVLERWRYDADYVEATNRLAEREAACQRWQHKLSKKPSDPEMARWLDSDRKILLDHAMRHYRLAPRNVISHAVIEAPAKYRKRARVHNGPWRYSKYVFLIFLLTADGVRQLTVEEDLENATFHNRERLNYRFDAVAAVEVTEQSGGPKNLGLTLVNGQSISVPVTDPGEEGDKYSPDFWIASKATEETSGIGSTLHVLEGIAAEGKQWIEQERRREDGRLTELRTALQGRFL
jgi:hypothetical protein